MHAFASARADALSPQPVAERAARPRISRARDVSRLDAPRSRARVDDVLVARLAVGDLAAEDALRARHHDALFNAAYEVIADEDEAREIAEATLDELFAGWPPERGRVAGWLRRRARRRARSRVHALGGD
jgi:hypothetical protein